MVLVVNLIKAHAMYLVFPLKFRVKYESPHMEFPRDLYHTFSILPYPYVFAVWLPYGKVWYHEKIVNFERGSLSFH